MKELPISSAFGYAIIQWNQEKDRSRRGKNPDGRRHKKDCALRRVPREQGLHKEK
jgi:hypothetical protein